MLYNRLLLRFCLFLGIFSGQVTISFAAVQPVVSEQSTGKNSTEHNAIDEGPAAFLKALHGIDPEALIARLEELKNKDLIAKVKRENEQRAAHFAILPEHVAQSVKVANDAYAHLAQLLRVENALGGLCKELDQALTQLAFENPSDQQEIIRGLGGLQIALKNGMFKQMSFPEQLPGGPEAQVIKGFQKAFFGNGEDAHFERPDLVRFIKKNDDLRERLERLSQAISKIPEGTDTAAHKALAEKAERLAIILSASKERDSRTLTSECIQLLVPDFQIVIQKLNEAISVLVDTRIQLASDADQKLKDGLDYWLKHTKAYRKTLNSFLSLASKVDIDFSFFLYSFSQIYDISSIFLRSTSLDVHNWDPLARVPNGVDIALRAVLAGAVCLHTAGDIANRGVQGGSRGIEGYLLGETSLEKFINPFDEWESVVPAMITSVFVAQCDPTKYAARMHKITRALCRIAGACAWYRIFGLEIPLGIIRDQNGKEVARIFRVKDPSGARFIVEERFDEVLNKPVRVRLRDEEAGSWKDSELLRFAAMETVREAQRFLDGYLDGTLTDAVDPIILEEVEKFSMGLVKPELIHLSLEIAVPMIFLKFKNNGLNNIICFENSDFFKHDFWFCKWLNSYKGSRGLAEDDFNNIERLYTEYKLIHYGCKNLGQFWGGTLTRALQIPVLSMLMKTGKIIGSGVLSIIDLFYPDDVNLPDLIDEKLTVDEDIFDDDFSIFDLLTLGEMRQFAVLSTEKGRIWLKKQVVMFFQENSQIRMLGIQMLMGLGLLNVGLDEPNPLEINYKLITTLLHYLTIYNVFSHSQNAELLELYLQYQRNVEPFLDHLIEQIKGNIAAAVGGYAGSWAGSVVAHKIVWDYRAPTLLGNPIH